MSRGHGELQRWVLAELAGQAERACPEDCTARYFHRRGCGPEGFAGVCERRGTGGETCNPDHLPGHRCAGEWMSASELAEARCRHLHGDTHAWSRRSDYYRGWPQRVSRSAGCTCPDRVSLNTSIRRALNLLAAQGAIRAERVSDNADGGRGQLIASVA